jgi:Leucine-rich repeat (LRR) protein
MHLLQELETLDCSNNRIRALPVSMCHMRKLSNLYCEENPLDNVPGKVLQRGVFEVLFHLAKLETEARGMAPQLGR